MITYKEYEESYWEQYITLWHLCFGTHTPPSRIRKKLKGIPRFQPLTIIAVDDNNDLAGAATGYPIYLKYRGEVCPSMQIGDAIVAPGYRRAGIFTELSERLVQGAGARGYKGMISFPAYSKPGSLKAMTNAGLTEVGTMTRFCWHLDKHSLTMRIARKLGDNIYNRLAALRSPAPVLDSQMIGELFFPEGAFRLSALGTQEYFRSKNIAEKIQLILPDAGAILMAEKFSLNIGLYYAATDQALNALMGNVLRLARKMGKDTVYYATSVGPEVSQLNRVFGFQQESEGAVLFRCIDSPPGDEKFSCNLRMFDLDTFF